MDKKKKTERENVQAGGEREQKGRKRNAGLLRLNERLMRRLKNKNRNSERKYNMTECVIVKFVSITRLSCSWTHVFSLCS